MGSTPDTDTYSVRRVEEVRLLPGALGTFSIAMQSISFVGPAFSALLMFQIVAGYAGVSVAFAFLMAGVII